MTEQQDIRERLAANAHDSWSRWMQHLFLKSETQPDGSVCIPAKLVKRWRLQSQTEYARLSKQEQLSDIREANRLLAALSSHGLHIKPGLDNEHGI